MLGVSEGIVSRDQGSTQATPRPAQDPSRLTSAVDRRIPPGGIPPPPPTPSHRRSHRPADGERAQQYAPGMTRTDRTRLLIGLTLGGIFLTELAAIGVWFAVG